MSDVVPGFYWLIEDELAGCACPGRGQAPGRSASALAPDGPDALERDLARLRRQGIGAVLSLTETPLPAEVVARQGLTLLHLPVPDLQAPTPDQFLRALAFIDHQRARGRAVVVHCLMGQGRTGTVLAAYRIRGGATPQGPYARSARSAPEPSAAPHRSRRSTRSPPAATGSSKTLSEPSLLRRTQQDTARLHPSGIMPPRDPINVGRQV